MPDYPDYVNFAFAAITIISTEEWIQRDVEAFSERWGGVDLGTFARVLQQAQGENRMVAAFAIGHTRSTWAKDLLLPFLQHDDPGVRWAAALSLGEIKDERARPVLIQMLQEFLPPPYTPSGEVGPDWFEVRHLHIASLLGQWGDPMLIPVLRETLVRVWQAERDVPENVNRAGIQLRQNYQDELVYALGQLGAFDALADIEVPTPCRRVWIVNLVLGYLNARACYKQSCIRLVADRLYSEKYQELHRFLLQILQGKVGLSLQEATTYLQEYGQNYFNRENNLPEIQQPGRET